LIQNNINIDEISCVGSIGGVLKPINGGVYEVNQNILDDLTNSPIFHPSNLGGLLAYKFSNNKIPSYIVDPISTDEMSILAKYSGSSLFKRTSLSHYLNPKAMAHRWAKENKKDYNKSNLIVVHFGSGISVSSHSNGFMIDVTNSSEEGPFSVERAGTIPSKQLAKLCFSDCNV
jgi:butyrate kinase